MIAIRNELERVGLEHEIRAKLKMGCDLTVEEEAYYFLIMASLTERFEYARIKKERQNGK